MSENTLKYALLLRGCDGTAGMTLDESQKDYMSETTLNNLYRCFWL